MGGAVYCMEARSGEIGDGNHMSDASLAQMESTIRNDTIRIPACVCKGVKVRGEGEG